MKFLLEFFKRKKNSSPEKPFKVVLPGNRLDPVLDRSSDTWRFIEKWATEELHAMRERNDSLNLNPEATCAIRGDIRRLKKLLKLDNQRPDQTTVRSKSFAAEIFGTDGGDE